MIHLYYEFFITQNADIHSLVRKYDTSLGMELNSPNIISTHTHS